MKKKATSASKATTRVGLLTSPLLSFASPNLPCGSPEPLFDFDLKVFNNALSSSSKKKKSTKAMTTSVLIKANTTNASSPSHKILTTISDLKEFVSSGSGSLKRQINLYNSEILKEFEASHSRLSKRFKIHTQKCQQVGDEAYKVYNKLSERICENVEAVKTLYADSIANVEASTTRVCKTSIAELAQSTEKAIEGLRSRYGIVVKAI